MLKFGKSGSYASLKQNIVYSADWRIRVRLFEAPFDHRRSFGIQPGLTQKSDQFLPSRMWLGNYRQDHIRVLASLERSRSTSSAMPLSGSTSGMWKRSMAGIVKHRRAPKNEVEGAYNKAIYLPRRRIMMQGWVDFLDETRKSVKAGRRVSERGTVKRSTLTHARAPQPTA
jgi:hypothetical protein